MHKRAGWNHNVQYHDFILRKMPSGCQRALDAGCGRGEFALKMMEYCDEVAAIDLDRVQGEDSHPGIEYIEGDVMTYPFPEQSFDFITAIATLHHLPLEPALLRFGNLLKPGGVLVILGLYRQKAITDYLLAAAAFPVSRTLRWLRGYSEVTAQLAVPETTLREIRAASLMLLPGSVLRRQPSFQILPGLAQAVRRLPPQ